jgi:two-component system, NarL family, sensor histidine kinase UhpB
MFFMPQSETTATSSLTHLSPWRDIVLVAVVTVACVLLAAHFELSEALYAHTRQWEHFELDEWPVAAFVLALCLVWISWSRYQQTLTQLNARRAAEARLAAALAENRELAQQYLRIQESERKHLARELHDELGQYLNAIKIDAVTIRESVAAESSAPARSAELAAHRTVLAVDHVYGVVSDMIRRLRPVGLDELGLVAALENCVDHWRQRLPETRFTLDTSGELDDLGEIMNLTIFRLIQEGLTNSYKHAGASSIEIGLSRAQDVVLTVVDDGRGVDMAQRGPGFGLSGMRERVEMMGGAFSVESSPGGGFSIQARLPATGRE